MVHICLLIGTGSQVSNVAHGSLVCDKFYCSTFLGAALYLILQCPPLQSYMMEHWSWTVDAFTYLQDVVSIGTSNIQVDRKYKFSSFDDACITGHWKFYSLRKYIITSFLSIYIIRCSDMVLNDFIKVVCFAWD